MNDQHSQVTQQDRTVRVHVPPRDLEQRRLDRAAGIGANGLPTARALGISPRQLMRRYGLDRDRAAIASRELLTRRHRELRDAAEL